MARETAEIPAAAGRLLARADLFTNLAERIERAKPRIMVFCGRGSSGHVGVYLRYIFEVRLGMVAPAATASELVLPIGAGTEQSVAATKTVVLSMIAGAQLVAALAQDDDLSGGLRNLPQRLSGEIACDWLAWAERAAGAAAAFVVGRGYGLGCVREIALKVSEILRVPALGYSAAELRHGPRASVTPATPVLVLRQNDPAAIAIDELVRDLNEARETVFAAGGAAGTLPWIGDGHPACDPVAMLIPAYRAIEAVARRRGYDPDKPPHLSKVTRTL